MTLCDKASRAAKGGLCNMHRQRVRKTGDVDPPVRKGKPYKAVVRYEAAHHRVWSTRGRADAHACVDCGGQAAEWSYNWQDPNNLIDGIGRVYSVTPSYYDPRCKACHEAFDHGRARAA